jgi:hypothetical protein
VGAVDVYLDAIKRADDNLRRAVEELTVEELRNQPAGPGSNPIGWLVWHMTRTRDNIVASVTGKQSIWEREGWGAKFGMEGQPPRFVPEDVHTFDPKSFDTLMGYFEAVATQTGQDVEALADDEMGRMIEPTVPGRPAQPVSARLGVILNDNIQHVGQVAYLRGLIRGQGWF